MCQSANTIALPVDPLTLSPVKWMQWICNIRSGRVKSGGIELNILQQNGRYCRRDFRGRFQQLLFNSQTFKSKYVSTINHHSSKQDVDNHERRNYISIKLFSRPIDYNLYTHWL